MADLSDLYAQLAFLKAGGREKGERTIDKINAIFSNIAKIPLTISALREAQSDVIKRQLENKRLQQEQRPLREIFGVPSVQEESAKRAIFEDIERGKTRTVAEERTKALLGLPEEERKTLTEEELQAKGFIPYIEKPFISEREKLQKESPFLQKYPFLMDLPIKDFEDVTRGLYYISGEGVGRTPAALRPVTISPSLSEATGFKEGEVKPFFEIQNILIKGRKDYKTLEPTILRSLLSHYSQIPFPSDEDKAEVEKIIEALISFSPTLKKESKTSEKSGLTISKELSEKAGAFLREQNKPDVEENRIWAIEKGYVK